MVNIYTNIFQGKIKMEKTVKKSLPHLSRMQVFNYILSKKNVSWQVFGRNNEGTDRGERNRVSRRRKLVPRPAQMSQ